ncbi:MAG: glycosyltransferase family 4 protein [Blastocatellia bacterium]|nr:glycosyltransferase family 4 protein [Blastocatellia bacterium]MDW8168854.1 glycosyltransferase family 4 protein [Acidobacteriota bacterium]
MRLLVLNQYFYPDVAATGQLLTELCTSLAREHDVQVITGFPTYDPLELQRRGLFAREDIDGVRVFRVYTWHGSRKTFASRAATYVTFLCSALLAGLVVRRPDVVMTWTDPPLLPLVGWVIALARRRPLVVVVQDVYPEVAVRVGILRHPWIIRLMNALISLPLRRATRVVAISEGMRRRLLEKGVSAENIVVIPNWADGRAIVPCERTNAFARAHGLDRTRVVLHSGNVGLVQDFETLLRCAERLRSSEDSDGVRIVIIGDGASKQRLQKEVVARRLTNVLFLPYQPRERVRYSLASADVSVILLKPGLEGYVEPSKVYAIMASGRPFVAAIGSRSEVARIARAHACGVIVSPGQPDALAEALRALLTDRSQRERLGQNGRAALLRFYDRSRAVNRYDRMLRALHREVSSHDRPSA